MAYIGMKHLLAVPISSHTDGSAISYGTGLIVSTAVAANLTINRNDNPDYGDDIRVDEDRGVTGIDGTLEVNDLDANVRNKILGYKAVTDGNTVSPAITHYSVDDTNPPEVGWGFIQVKQYKNVKSFVGWFFHKARFAEASLNATTKRQQIEWQHPQISVTGLGAYIDATGNAKWYDYMEFETYSAAETWLNSKCNYTPPSSN